MLDDDIAIHFKTFHGRRNNTFIFRRTDAMIFQTCRGAISGSHLWKVVLCFDYRISAGLFIWAIKYYSSIRLTHILQIESVERSSLTYKHGTVTIVIEDVNLSYLVMILNVGKCCMDPYFWIKHFQESQTIFNFYYNSLCVF